MTSESVQVGHQYPNVVRVLKPGTDEYDWFNGGGTYPFALPVLSPVDDITVESTDLPKNYNMAKYLVSPGTGANPTWSLNNNPPGVTIDPITGLMTVAQVSKSVEPRAMVFPTGSGSIHLQWQGPYLREDGTEMQAADIHFFRVRLAGSNGTATVNDFLNLDVGAIGTREIIAVDTLGVESVPTSIVMAVGTSAFTMVSAGAYTEISWEYRRVTAGSVWSAIDDGNHTFLSGQGTTTVTVTNPLLADAGQIRCLVEENLVGTSTLLFLAGTV